MKETYTIIFSGKTVQGESAETVKNRLLSLYNDDSEKIEILLSGNPIVIKRNVDHETALEFKNIFEQFGAVLDIVPSEKTKKAYIKPAAPSSPSSNPPHDSHPVEKITCPSCGFKQPRTNECAKCRIIIQKFNKRNSEIAMGLHPIQNQKKITKSPTRLKNTEKKGKRSRGLFKKFRIAILLLILVIVGLNEYLSNKNISSWKRPLTVAIYPINKDNSDQAATYIESINNQVFQPIEYFMQEEGQLCNLSLEKPVMITVAPEIPKHPPKPPVEKTALNVMMWSLKMRYWAFRNDPLDTSKDVKIYVLYSSPENYQIGEVSMGLKKGKIGIVNASADKRLENRNNVIITHEMLHTFGATDKYDYASSMPVYPHGLADPKRKPLYPQDMAEIMAGRIPVSNSEIKWPANFDEVTIGVKTCVEINWLNENHLARLEAEL